MSPEFLKRSDNDFLKRSLAGILAHMLIWPLLAWFSGFYSLAPSFNNTFNMVFVLLGAVRLLQAYSHSHLYDQYPKLCRTIMLSLCLGHAITLGALLLFITLIPEYQHMIMMGVMVAVGFSSGAAASLSIKPIFSKFYIALVLCPAAIACLFTDSLKHFMLIYIILCAYFFLLSKRFYSEYIQAFEIENELKAKQKLLEKLTITDTLTGVYNRQYFDNTLDMQWSLASRSQAYLSILFLDLDFFKKVNDVYGHVVGDTALCHAANIFKDESKRKSDMVARYGGEEFAIILAGTNHQDACKLAERVRERIENTPVIHGDNSINITVSIGVNTTIPNNQSNCTEFLDNADQALYEAKSQGRNRVMGFNADQE